MEDRGSWFVYCWLIVALFFDVAVTLLFHLLTKEMNEGWYCCVMLQLLPSDSHHPMLTKNSTILPFRPCTKIWLVGIFCCCCWRVALDATLVHAWSRTKLRQWRWRSTLVAREGVSKLWRRLSSFKKQLSRKSYAKGLCVCVCVCVSVAKKTKKTSN